MGVSEERFYFIYIMEEQKDAIRSVWHLGMSDRQEEICSFGWSWNVLGEWK
jgi:hypothetical protein